MRRSISVIFSALFLLASCCEPTSSNVFLKSSERDAFGRYEYKLDMSDSLHAYDISFYTRLDASVRDFTTMGDIPLSVRMYNPAGICYEEKVFIPVDKPSFSTAFSRQYKALYRKDSTPSVYGEWTMQVEIPDFDISGCMTGLGVEITKK